jgi:hypothetical protein
MLKMRLKTLLLLVLALFVFAGVAHAEEQWVTDPKSGAKICWTVPGYKLTAAGWSGPVVDGKAEGKGVLTVTVVAATGDTITGQFDGEMLAGKLHGPGKAKMSNGDTFSGSFADGRLDGKGVYKWGARNGRYYEGEFKNGKQDGHGVYKEANGKVIYEGEYKDDVPAMRPSIDKVLGIPWGASPDEVKKAMQERPGTTLRYAWKEGSRNVQQYLGPFSDRVQWIFFWFNEGRLYGMAAHFSAPEAQLDQVMERLEVTRRGLAERYGPADHEKGKYIDAKYAWYWPGKYAIMLGIEKQSAPEPGFGMWLRYFEVEGFLKAEGKKLSAAKNDY